MNEKTINEQYAYIRTLLEEKRLKEALMQLESLLWQCPDWDLRTRLEQLQTSYKYMLEYMRQGANDPERWNVYRKLIADTWEIADRSRLLMLDNASSRYYHEVRRTPRPESLSAYTLKKLLHMLESFNDDLAVSGLLSDEKMDGTDIRVPFFTSYDAKTGQWIIENHGVDPDILIDNDPVKEWNGEDEQLNKAIEEVMKELQNRKPLPPVPAPRDFSN